MSFESIFFEENFSENDKKAGFSDISLLYSNSHSLIYSAKYEGKRFLLKTVNENIDESIIRREWELSMGCSHPNIVHVYSYERGLLDKSCLVMEYIEGRTLWEFLQENPPRALRRRILDQLLSAAGYLHSRGIVHNDLKPENILISRVDNDLKLIDFGLSGDDIHDLSRIGGFSPYYCSPEISEAVLHGRKVRIDSRSDIYSIGIIMESLLPSCRLIARKCKAFDKEKRYGNIDRVKKAVRLFRALPAISAAIVILAGLGGTIVLQNRKISEMADSYNAEISSLKADAEKFEERAEEVEKKEEESDKKVESLKKEIDDWGCSRSKTLRNIKDRDKAQEYYQGVLKEYNALFSRMQNDTEPLRFEEIRRHLCKCIAQINEQMSQID